MKSFSSSGSFFVWLSCSGRFVLSRHMWDFVAVLEQLLGAGGRAGGTKDETRSIQPASARNDAAVQAGEKETPQR